MIAGHWAEAENGLPGASNVGGTGNHSEQSVEYARRDDTCDGND